MSEVKRYCMNVCRNVEVSQRQYSILMRYVPLRVARLGQTPTCFLTKNRLHSIVGTLELVPGSISKSGVLWMRQVLLLKAKIGTSQNTMCFVVFICPLATPELLSNSSSFEND